MFIVLYWHFHSLDLNSITFEHDRMRCLQHKIIKYCIMQDLSLFCGQREALHSISIVFLMCLLGLHLNTFFSCIAQGYSMPLLKPGISTAKAIFAYKWNRISISIWKLGKHSILWHKCQQMYVYHRMSLVSLRAC